MVRLPRNTRVSLALVAGLAAMLGVGLGHPILNIDEGLYARVAQGMADGGSWIVPSLEGVPYLEKPPLVYWVTALAFKAFGASSWSARSASLLGAAIMLGSVYLIGARRLGRRAAVYSVLMLASFPLVISMARTLMFDMLFTGLLAASLVTLHEALASERPAPWMRLSAVLLAGAVLAKGLAAPLFYGAVAAVLVLAAPAEERRTRAAAVADPIAIAIFLALAVPWHVAVAAREPSFAWFYFVNEHLLRFLGMRIPHDYHSGPPWYYLPRIVLYAFPWVLLLLVPAPRGAVRGLLRGFIGAWILVPLAIFSASSAKGDYYMIVALPPLALLLGARLAALGDARAFALVPVGWMGVLAAAMAYLSLMPLRFRPPEHAALVLALGFALCAGSLAALRLRHTAAAVAVSAAMAVPVALLLSGFIAANGELKSAERLAAAIHARSPSSVYLFRDYERFSALPFYVRTPVGVIDSASSDLWYGLRLRHDRSRFPTMAQFERELGTRPVVVVVAAAAVADFRTSALGKRFSPVGTFGEAWLFASRAPPRMAAAGPHTRPR